MVHTILPYLPYVLGILVLIWLSTQLFTNIKSNQIGVKERKLLGKEMAEGRTVALPGEVGIQAKILGPGLHFIVPFLEKVTKSNFVKIENTQIGLVTAISGAPIPDGEYFAKSIECELFQDGEKFLTNGGQKGPQLQILPPGEHRINPHLFQVTVKEAVVVEDDQIGIVEARGGKTLTNDQIAGDPVDSNDYQDAQAFINNGGQKGLQQKTLPPGLFRINTLMFDVKVKPQTVIKGGEIGLVVSIAGKKTPEGRVLASKIPDHNSFQDATVFLKNGGQKGRQIEVLMPGRYRINTDIFQIAETVPQTAITSEQVGIVTVKEGAPITDENQIAAKKTGLELHNSFQDGQAFIDQKGEKGLQQEVLRAGMYAINPWFAAIDLEPMTKVEIGECAVVTSFVGEEGTDTTDANVNAKIVENGKKGIWKDPLGPGKHPLNTRICRINKVPTTQILLSWANDESSAHKFDSNLKTITLRTADAFNVNMDVRVIIHIAMIDAPKVVANLGSVENMISQVLEPAISSHFRNAAQAVKALGLYTSRAELQEKAKEHIQSVLKVHHIESKDTMIADVVLPVELTKTVTDRQIAEQEKTTYKTQKEAQDERRTLENATAQANMQAQVVQSERNVEIEKNIAEGQVKKADGLKQAAVLSAEGKAEARKLEANAEAEAIKVTAGAEAEATKLNASANKEKGFAEAEVILKKGTSTAEAYKLEVAAMGQANFGRINALKEIKEFKFKLVPDVLIGGGAGGSESGPFGNLVSISLLEKLTGKDFLSYINDGKEQAPELVDDVNKKDA